MTRPRNCNSGSSATDDVQEFRARVLCLGNELLADDSLGLRVAEQCRQFATHDVEVVSTTEGGFHLLDYVSGIHRLIVVDTVVTGTSRPGTIYVCHDYELKAVPGGSPHYVGLCETLGLARQLRLPVAEEVIFLAVEASDCSTLGGRMHSDVRAAIPQVTRLVQDLLRQPC